MASAAILCLALLQAAPERLAPPDAAALKEAEGVVRDLLKAQPAPKTADAKRQLARELLSQADDAKKAPALRWTLCRTAREHASGGGDYALAFEAVDALRRTFAGDVAETEAGALLASAKGPFASEALRALLDGARRAVEAGAADDRYEASLKLADQAAAAAAKAQEPGWARRFQARKREIAALKARHEALKKVRETLAASPDDADANLAWGTFRAFVKGAFEEGLPHLAKGSDAGLRALAAADLKGPKEAIEQVEAGNGWLQRASKEPAAHQAALIRRAEDWFERAKPMLRIEECAQLEKKLTPLRVGLLTSRGSWTDATDPALFGRKGAKGRPIEVEPRSKTSVEKLNLDPTSTRSFNGVLVRARFRDEAARGGYIGIAFEPRKRNAFIDGTTGQFCFSIAKEGGWVSDFTLPLPGGDPYVISAAIEHGEYVIALNGKEAHRTPTLFETLPLGLTLDAAYVPVVFEQILLRKAD
jgi:hypothetical protein